MSAVAVETDGPVTRITLNRPDKLNAFNDALVDGATAALAEAERAGARLVVFQGAGKGFSGGFDLGAVEEMSDGDLLLRFVRVEALLQAVHHARAATVALVRGSCYGAAADLVAACQWRVAAPGARFRMPGARFGLVLGTARLVALIGEDRARALLLHDAPFSAEQAMEAGFLTEIAEQESWDRVGERIAAHVMTLDAETFAALSARKRRDTRAEDLAALVRSVAAGSVKARIRGYLAEMAAARAGRAG